MKTQQELSAMLPAPVEGVPGCADYNARRDAALQTADAARRHVTARLDHIQPDDPKAREIEREGDKAELAYTLAVSRLKRERDGLLCEPSAPTGHKPLFETGSLEVPASTPGAESFNAKVRDFGRRQGRTLDGPLMAWNKAVVAWAETETDAARRAMNKARAALETADKPFAAERRRLAAARATLMKKVKVTK